MITLTIKYSCFMMTYTYNILKWEEKLARRPLIILGSWGRVKPQRLAISFETLFICVLHLMVILTLG